MGKRIFVTGASGRIGRRLVAKLCAEGHEVTGLARTEATAQRVREAGGTAVVGRLSDVAKVREGAKGAVIVYHLAGGVRGPGTETPEVLNVEGTKHLIEALEDGVEAVVLASTSAIYGDRSGLWVEEDMPAHPNTDYGKSKAKAERLLLDSDLPSRIARIGAVYGPGFPIMLVDRMKKGRAWLPGEGRNTIPLIHVDDCVSALIAIAEKGTDGEVYNVAGPEPVPLSEFYDVVHQAVGGSPVRFWSTWVPSYVQRAIAARNELLMTRLNRRPRLTPDKLNLYTYNVKMRVERIEKELDFEWKYPDIRSGIAAATEA